MMVLKKMEILNSQYWSNDREQISDMGWIAKTETESLQELSSYQTIQEFSASKESREGSWKG